MSAQYTKLQPIFAAFICLHLVAVFTTCLRLVHRRMRRQMWWDDLAAGLSILGELWIVIMYISLGVRVKDSYPQNVRDMWDWMSLLATPFTMWMARIAIILAIIRLLPQGRNRLITQGSAAIFGLMFFTIMMLRTLACGAPVPRNGICQKPLRTTWIHLSFCLISTLWLVCWPTFILRRMKLPNYERNLIIACFASGVSLIAVDIGHAANLAKAEKVGPMAIWKQLNVTGNLQVICAVLCCNSLVLVTFIYRWTRSRLSKKDSTGVPEETGTSDVYTTTNGGTTTGETRTTSTGTKTQGTGIGTQTCDIFTSGFTSVNTDDVFLTSGGVTNDNSSSTTSEAKGVAVRIQVEGTPDSSLSEKK